jgi:5-methylcytosine-specific restriction protein A
MPTAKEFREHLFEAFRIAELDGRTSVFVNAGYLHRAVGGYPNRKTNRMPVCCDAMLRAMRKGDVIVSQPPKGKGATLTIRYALPRSAPTQN